jgi:hypothetical protein
VTPKIARRGVSFKGAAAYYLHDKGADTNRRVAFCVTRNLPTGEPELAWRWMAYTDRHAGILKHDAGAARTGPKERKPVYTLSLSWHADDKPTPDLMVAMMDSALKKIGLGRCQSLYVAHNDTDHPHIHALVNLVDPDNGKIIDPGQDRYKLSRWAQGYEARAGTIRCQRRVENNARRDQGEWVVDRHSKTRQDIEQAKLIEGRILAERRRQLGERQLRDRATLKRHAATKAHAIRAQLKERFCPQWAAFYQRQRQDARELAKAECSILSRMRVAIGERGRLQPEGTDWIAGLVKQILRSRALAEAMRAAQERELDQLRQRLAEERAAAIAEVWVGYRRDYGTLREAQAEARTAPPPLAAPDEAAHRADLRARFAARAKVRERQKPEAAPTPTPGKRSTPGVRPGPRHGGGYDALKAATPKPAPPPPAREAPGGKPVQKLRLPQPGDDEARRREELKAEFRRQAEEIARRRRERKQKDRDRDRER